MNAWCIPFALDNKADSLALINFQLKNFTTIIESDQTLWAWNLMYGVLRNV